MSQDAETPRADESPSTTEPTPSESTPTTDAKSEADTEMTNGEPHERRRGGKGSKSKKEPKPKKEPKSKSKSSKGKVSKSKKEAKSKKESKSSKSKSKSRKRARDIDSDSEDSASEYSDSEAKKPGGKDSDAPPEPKRTRLDERVALATTLSDEGALRNMLRRHLSRSCNTALRAVADMIQHFSPFASATPVEFPTLPTCCPDPDPVEHKRPCSGTPCIEHREIPSHVPEELVNFITIADDCGIRLLKIEQLARERSTRRYAQVIKECSQLHSSVVFGDKTIRDMIQPPCRSVLDQFARMSVSTALELGEQELLRHAQDELAVQANFTTGGGAPRGPPP